MAWRQAPRIGGCADMKARLRHGEAVTREGAPGFRQLPGERCMARVVHHVTPA
jgi:hypothetical protein